MAEKQLLIEACDFSFNCNLSDEKKTALTESLKISAGKNDTLIVKNVPCTILNRRNQNGRVYPTALMQKAIEEARPKMQNRELICSGSEHPEMSYCPLEKGSHVVINAYIKNVDLEVEGEKGRYDVLFNDWLVLPTDPHGKNLKTYILNNISVGTSIRSLGSCDPDGTVTELEYLGTDCVSQPSSGTRTIMNMNESVEVAAAPLTETFIVSASATNVVRDLDQALVLANDIENANFGTVKKTSTKLDSEVDPKTGAETTMVTLETETEDEVSELDQALALAKQAIMNGRADIDSVTIENVKEEQPKESVENSETPLNEEEGHYADLPHLTPITNQILRNYPKDSEAYKAALRIQNDLIAGRLEDRNAALEELKKYIDVEYIPESEMGNSAGTISGEYKANQVGSPEKRAERIAQMQYNFIVSNTQEADPERQQAENIFAKFEQGQASAIDTREALYNIAFGLQKKLWGESALDEAGVDKLHDIITNMMWNEGLTVEEACRKFCEQNDNVPYDYLLEYMRTNPVNESVMIEEPLKAILSYALGIDGWYHAKLGGSLANLQYIDKQLNKLIKTYHMLVTDRGEPYIDFDYMKEDEMNRLLKALQDKLHVRLDVYNPTADLQGESVKESTNDPVFNAKSSFTAINAYHQHCNDVPGIEEIYNQAKEVMDKLEQKEIDAVKGAEILDKLHHEGIQKILHHGFGESTITEAKEEEQEDPNNGKQYVLKCKTNDKYVAMNGNAIDFVDDPKEAIHFIKGNEESGVIHLSGINKILNTMGILDSDIERYFKKDSIDISAHDDVNVQAAESDGIKVEECGNKAPITEDNGSNTRFKATVKINGANGESTEDVSVSAVDMDGINAEVSNLYDMKKQNAEGELSIIVMDTSSGQQFMYNPESRQIEAMNTQVESAGDLEQDGNKLSMEVDDNNKVEKEFDTPAQAAVAKAGIESGKMGGDVLLSEDDTEEDEESETAKCEWCGEEFEKSALKKEKDLGYLCNTCAKGIASREGPLTFEEADDEIPVRTDISYENIEPGWYASAPSVGFVGPYDTEEELRNVLGKEVCEIADSGKGLVNIDYVEDDEAVAAESTQIDEVLYNKPSEASDPFVEKPLKDSIMGDIIFEINNIDWNNDSLYDTFLANYNQGDKLNFDNLPSEAFVRVNSEELPDDITAKDLKEYLIHKLEDMYKMNVDNADVVSINYVN